METGTAVGWRLAGVGVVVLLLAAGFIGTSCPPPPSPVTADSLAAARATFAADTARAWGAARRAQAVADSALRVSQTAQAEAARLRTRRITQPVRVAYTSDSVPMVPKANYDSLAAEADSLWSVVRADSVALTTQSARIAADSSAYASLRAILGHERAQYGHAIAGLQREVAQARRGCRVLGLLPCPEVSAGWGATLTGGQVRTGPVLAVTLPVRF